MKIARLNRWINLQAGVATEGKPRRFAIEAYDGGPLPVDGFDLPVIVDLSGIENQQAMPLLIDHEGTVEATLGDVDTIENSGQSLSIAGAVTGVSDKCQIVLTAADNGQRWQASIGCRILQLEEIKAGQLVTVNKQSFRGPVLVARKSQWYETSVLPAGADWTTTVNLAAKAARLLKGTATMPTFEEWCKAINVDPAGLSEDDKAALMLAYDAKQKPAATAAATATTEDPAKMNEEIKTVTAKVREELLAGMRQTRADEESRIQAIELVTVGHPLIRATAIREGWDATKAELAACKEQLKIKAPSNTHRSSSGGALSPQVLEAAICMTRNIPGHEKRFSDQVLQEAKDTFGRNGIGLQQMFLMAAAESGYSIGPGEKVGAGNMSRVMKAAFSTVSLPGILSNVANKELLAGYQEEDAAWKEIAKIKDVSDFKQVTSYRMLSDMTYELVPPGGEIKHGKVSEESYTRQVKTYGKMFVLTREDIINDDLGVFDGLREEIGRGAAKKLNEIFWTAFINNSSFFTTARTNYIEGATTNLALDGVGLGLAVKQFRKMTSPSADGTKRVGAGLRPEILLVPPELEANAETLFRATNLAAVKASDANIYANKYRPVVAWQLSDSGYTGYSTTAFYLLANPASMPTMVTSFLNGVQTPTVESDDVEFSRLGVQIRAYHDWGCDQAEYLGGLKSKGAA